MVVYTKTVEITVTPDEMDVPLLIGVLVAFEVVVEVNEDDEEELVELDELDELVVEEPDEPVAAGTDLPASAGAT